MLVSCDYHIHTFHSYCAGKEMSLEAICGRARRLGLETAGISDHLWLDAERVCRPSVEHLMDIRGEMDGVPRPPRLLLGAEADCAPAWGAAGGPALARLDYAIGSYHFGDVRLGAERAPETAEGLARLLLAGFGSVVTADHVSIAGHPFHIPRKILRGLSGPVRADPGAVYALIQAGAGPLLETARDRGVALELNARALGPIARTGLLPVFRKAREAGCRFVVSSDAHHPHEMDRRADLGDYAGAIGLGAGDLWPGPGAG